jgi:hypothetical protein
MQAEVTFDLPAFLLQQHRRKERRSEPLCEEGEHPGTGCRSVCRDGMPVIRQQLLPQRDVPVLHSCQLAIDLGALRVRLEAGQDPIQVGSVGLVLEVMEPFGWGSHWE